MDKRHRKWVFAALLAACLAMFAMMSYVWIAWTTPPPTIGGVWSNSTPYLASAPGTIIMTIQDDGRAKVTAAANANLWWVASNYTLRFSEDSILVRDDKGMFVGELLLRRTRNGLSILDPSLPTLDPSLPTGLLKLAKKS